jgi:hypothetical protein
MASFYSSQAQERESMNKVYGMAVGLGVALAVSGSTGATAAAAHYTTADTPISALLADPASKAVIDKDIPGMSENPSISVVGTMTLRALQPMSPDKLTDKTLDQVDADLAKIPPK